MRGPDKDLPRPYIHYAIRTSRQDTGPFCAAPVQDRPPVLCTAVLKQKVEALEATVQSNTAADPRHARRCQRKHMPAPNVTAHLFFLLLLLLLFTVCLLLLL